MKEEGVMPLVITLFEKIWYIACVKALQETSPFYRACKVCPSVLLWNTVQDGVTLRASAKAMVHKLPDNLKLKQGKPAARWEDALAFAFGFD